MTATSRSDDGGPDDEPGPRGVSVEGVFRRRGLVARHHPLTVLIEVPGSSFTADSPLPAALLAVADTVAAHPDPDFAAAAEALQDFVVEHQPTGVAAVLDGPEPILFLLDNAFATEPVDDDPRPEDQPPTPALAPIDGIPTDGDEGPGRLDGGGRAGRAAADAALPIDHRGVEPDGWVTSRLTRRSVEVEVGGLGSDPVGIVLRGGVVPGTRAVVPLTRCARPRPVAVSPPPGHPGPGSATTPSAPAGDGPTPEPPAASHPSLPKPPAMAPAAAPPDLSHLPPPPGSAAGAPPGPPRSPERAAPPPGPPAAPPGPGGVDVPGARWGGAPPAPTPDAASPGPAPPPDPPGPATPTGPVVGAVTTPVGTLFDLERGTRYPVAGPILIGADPRRAAADDPGATVIIVEEPGVGEVQVRIVTSGGTAVAQNIGGGAAWVQSPGAPVRQLEGHSPLVDRAQIRVASRIFGYRAAGPSVS
ncbi:MAG: hypothetical protein ACK5RL_01750 [Acidimicrobiales bacterium]